MRFSLLCVMRVIFQVPAHFRRADSLALGPLTLWQPQFMEMPVPGLVAGTCRPVVGIIGYDVFRRAVVELVPMTDVESFSPRDPNFIVKLHDVDKNLKLPELAPSGWSRLHMVCLHGCKEQELRAAICLLDYKSTPHQSEILHRRKRRLRGPLYD